MGKEMASDFRFNQSLESLDLIDSLIQKTPRFADEKALSNHPFVTRPFIQLADLNLLLILPTNMSFTIIQPNLPGFIRHLHNNRLLLPQALHFFLALDTDNFLHTLLGIS
jgi:hypothetical protein